LNLRCGNRIHTGLLAAVLAALALAACTSEASGTGEPIPADATLVVRIEPAAILADDSLDDLLAALPLDEGDPADVNDVLAMVLDEPGVDFRRIQEVLVFATDTDMDQFGFIVTGTYDMDEMLADVETSDGSPVVENVSGTSVYTFLKDSNDSFSIATLSAGRFVAGDFEAVRGAIWVDTGEAPASGDLIARLDALGTPWLSLVADVSAGDADKLLGEDGPAGSFGGDLPIDLSAFEDMRVVTLVIDRRGDDFIAEAELGFTSQESAVRAADMIDGFSNLFKALAPDPDLVAFLDDLEIEATGSDVSIAFKISTDDAVDLVGNLFNVFGEDVEFELPDLDLN
jgi:hypothetical protein